MKSIFVAASAALVALLLAGSANAESLTERLSKQVSPSETTRNCVEHKANAISEGENNSYRPTPVLLDMTGLPSNHEGAIVKFEVTGMNPETARKDQFGYVRAIFSCRGTSSLHTEYQAYGQIIELKNQKGESTKYLSLLIPFPTAVVTGKARIATKLGTDRYLGQWTTYDNAPAVLITKYQATAEKKQ